MFSFPLLQVVPQAVDSAQLAKAQSILNPDSLLEKAPTNISELKNIPWGDILHGMVSQVVTFFFHLLIAVAVFYVGKFVINKLHSVFKALLQ